MLLPLVLVTALAGLATSEVSSRYALLLPSVPGKYYTAGAGGTGYSSGGSGYNSGGSGYNGGDSGYSSGGSGYNGGGSGYNSGGGSGYTGGQGYNPGYSGQGSAVVAFSARRAALCCRDPGARVRFEVIPCSTYLYLSLTGCTQVTDTSLGGGWDARSGMFTVPASGAYSFSWTGLSTAGRQLRSCSVLLSVVSRQS